MMGVNSVPPMPPRLEIVKPAPCMSAPGSLPSRALPLRSPSAFATANTSSLSAPLMTGTSRPLGVSAAKPTLKNFLKMRFWPGLIELAVEHRELAHRAHRRLDDERERRHLDAGGRGLFLERAAQRFEFGDVRFVELRDVRDVDPRRLQARAGDLLHAIERLDLDRAERGRVVVVRLGQRRRRGDRATARHHQLHERLDVVEQDAALLAAAAHAAEIHAELAREFAHRRTRHARLPKLASSIARQAAARRRNDLLHALRRGRTRRGCRRRGFVRRGAGCGRGRGCRGGRDTLHRDDQRAGRRPCRPW